MEYIVNYIVAALLAVVALVALVQTAISRKGYSEKTERPRPRDPHHDLSEQTRNLCEQEGQSAVHDRQKDNDFPR